MIPVIITKVTHRPAITRMVYSDKTGLMSTQKVRLTVSMAKHGHGPGHQCHRAGDKHNCTIAQAGTNNPDLRSNGNPG